jgi:hypothetical protein
MSTAWFTMFSSLRLPRLYDDYHTTKRRFGLARANMTNAGDDPSMARSAQVSDFWCDGVRPVHGAARHSDRCGVLNEVQAGLSAAPDEISWANGLSDGRARDDSVCGVSCTGIVDTLVVRDVGGTLHVVECALESLGTSNR